MKEKSRGRDKFKKYKKLILFLSKAVSILPTPIRINLLNFFRNTKGTKGIVLRYIFLKTISRSVGDNVAIHENVYLHFPENIKFGNNVSIHPMCYIDACGKIDIGNEVSIAHSTTILSTSHVYDNLTIPIKDQDYKIEKTSIEDGVWIGAKSTVLLGVTLGKNSIVGANSLVNKDIPENAVVGGIPAKTLKMRI